MSDAFWSGALTAWAVVELILAGFFLLAYYKGRREAEYLVFSALCLVLGGHDAANALRFGSDGGNTLTTLRISHGLGIVAVALYVHFALCFAQVRRPRVYLVPLYGLALFYEVLIWSPVWWEGPGYRFNVAHVLGYDVHLAVARASPWGKSFSVMACLGVWVAASFFVRAYRAGRREALSLLMGVSVLIPAGVHDLFLVLDLPNFGINLVPHALVLYGFGVAGTVLVRYRVAAVELEQATAALRDRNEELRHSHAELRLAQNELVTKRQLATVGELAAAIAHEVRNPLAVIVNAVSGLRRGGIKETDREMLLDIVDEEAGRLNRLVTDLLRFARPVTVKRSPILLAELAGRSRLAAKEGCNIQVDVCDDPMIQTVWLDPGLFRLVFDNLVENACQSMRAGGTVEISFARTSIAGLPAVCIEICDEGRGMPAEVQERALDPFFTTRPSGTGLGLPIVSRIVEAHGGQLTIHSEEGLGTTVKILVPVGAPLETRAGLSQDGLLQ